MLPNGAPPASSRPNDEWHAATIGLILTLGGSLYLAWFANALTGLLVF